MATLGTGFTVCLPNSQWVSIITTFPTEESLLKQHLTCLLFPGLLTLSSCRLRAYPREEQGEGIGAVPFFQMSASQRSPSNLIWK